MPVSNERGRDGRPKTECKGTSTRMVPVGTGGVPDPRVVGVTRWTRSGIEGLPPGSTKLCSTVVLREGGV